MTVGKTLFQDLVIWMGWLPVAFVLAFLRGEAGRTVTGYHALVGGGIIVSVFYPVVLQSLLAIHGKIRMKPWLLVPPPTSYRRMAVVTVVIAVLLWRFTGPLLNQFFPHVCENIDPSYPYSVWGCDNQ